MVGIEQNATEQNAKRNLDQQKITIWLVLLIIFHLSACQAEKKKKNAKLISMKTFYLRHIPGGNRLGVSTFGMTEILGGVKKPDFSTTEWHIESEGGHKLGSFHLQNGTSYSEAL